MMKMTGDETGTCERMFEPVELTRIESIDLIDEDEFTFGNSSGIPENESSDLSDG